MNKIASAGKYVAYPEYKNSGIEWLGKIPIHWSRVKFKFLARQGKVFASGPFGSSIGSQFYRDEGVPVIRGNNLSLNGNKPKYVDDGYVFLDEGKASDLSNAEVLPGDLVFTARGTVGQVGLVPDDGSIKWNRAILSANQLRYRNKNSELNPLFLWYLFSSWLVRTQILLSSDSVAQPNLNLGSLKDLHLLCPEYSEQKKIANFLDHQTTKIDTQIDKQQQLIKLLKEKRQAVISHAVTKGLNPNAQMRDSGVEWLDKVPEHWKVTRIKYHTNVFEQGWSPQCDSRPADDGEYGVLKVGCVNYGAFRNTENKALPKELVPQLQYLLKKDDLLISRANTKELVGSAAVVDGDYDNLILCDKLYRLRFREAINTQLVAYYLALPLVRQQIELEATGASHSMQNIGQATIKELPMVIPPTEEANELVLKIKEKIEVFDLTLDKANAQISLLQERRTALISAAVTGKIDVRHFTSQKGQVPKSSSQRVSK
jgi:type I restriction enzyme S subunit